VWRVTAVDPPTSLEFTDAFAETDGTPIADMPVSTIRVRLVDRERGTRMEMRAMFESREDMDKQGDGQVVVVLIDGFERGGWARPLFDREAMTFVDEVYQRADAFLFGRRIDALLV
jgi:uncharacterized protein YndB with AHSA1/START domain